MSPYYFKMFLFLLALMASKGWSQEAVEKTQTIYPKKNTQKSWFYNFLWGKHYREIYATPITAFEKQPSWELTTTPITGGFEYFKHFPEFNALYQSEDFEGTYSDRFIADAYTLIHPLAFVINNGLNRNLGLGSSSNEFLYIQDELHRTIPDTKNHLSTAQVISFLQENFKFRIDETTYVRARLVDILVGNQLDVNASYYWQLHPNQTDVFVPTVVDRGFSFAKKDGLLFGLLLSSLGIESNDNFYNKKLKSSRINKHNYTIDLALAGSIKKQTWAEQAQFIKTMLSEDVLQGIFAELPQEIQQADSSKELKKALIHRIAHLETLAKDYFETLQKIVIIKGTAQDDYFKIEQNQSTTRITLINAHTGEVISKNEYIAETTQEIWLYGFGGINTFSLTDNGKNDILIRIINNNNYNDFELEQAQSNIKIYTPESSLVTQTEVGNASLHKTDNPNLLEYNPKRPKEHTLDFTPGVLFDTDLSIRLGGKFTYTRYTFKNQPFSAQHELSWNHLYSLLYSGTFPTLNEKMTYKADVWLTTPNHFQNFFGFGNESSNHESSFGRDYNRVLLQRVGFDLGVKLNISEKETATFSTAIERYHIIDEQKFDRDDIFQEGELAHKNNVFMNLRAAYEISTEESVYRNFHYAFIPHIGMMINFKDMNRNVPYVGGELSVKFNPDVAKKYTVVSVLKAKSLFNSTYEFYQAATMGGETGLRGFRNERFSGQHYFLHSNDFRIDLGKLNNKLIPIDYEAFLGADYGRVWYKGENSQKWHTSFGGGFSFRFVNKFATNISYFTSSERPRIILSLGYFF